MFQTFICVENIYSCFKRLAVFKTFIRIQTFSRIQNVYSYFKRLAVFKTFIRISNV